MSATLSKRPDYLDPVKEAEAVRGLRASIAALNADDELLTDTIEGETRLFEIVDRVLERIREAEIMVEGIDAVAASLSERKRRHEEGQKRDRALLEQAMSIAGLATIVRPTATLSLTHRPPALVVTEESEIPLQFWKPGDPKLDRKALAEALKAGGETPIPGATLSNGAPSLTIRTK